MSYSSSDGDGDAIPSSIRLSRNAPKGAIREGRLPSTDKMRETAANSETDMAAVGTKCTCEAIASDAKTASVRESTYLQMLYAGILTKCSCPPPERGGAFDHAARKGSRASPVGERGSR